MTTIKIKPEGKRLYAVGNTYPVKDALKGIGAKWDPETKAWWVGTAKRAELEAIIAEQPAPSGAESLPALSGKSVPVSGNTYPVRDQLRALGASWDAGAKTWTIDEARLALAHAVVAKGSSEPPKPFRFTQCKQCGKRPDYRGWPRIYRNGVCSDCYRDASEDY